MTPIVLALMAAVGLAPLLYSLTRSRPLRGRRESAMALHRAQLTEIDRDLAEGRISGEDHVTAKLEIQRRLLAAADDADPEPVRGGRVVIFATLLIVPIAAAGMYMIDGHPELPSEPLAERVARAKAEMRDQSQLIAQLKTAIAGLDQHSEKARDGYVLLGNVEEQRGNLAGAAAAWKSALAIKFDATLAAEAAEVQTQLDGHVTPDTAALFRQALSNAPPDAPWREMVQQRLAQAQ